MRLFQESRLERGDGGTNAESYLASYWRELAPMGSVYVVIPAAAALMLVVEAIHITRTLRGSVKGLEVEVEVEAEAE